ncbi:hypothetical protein HDV05_000599 [Chytridiales sp. JEL 0842]|nr:hypothetical protein HDV05_000599 [Chytridiales sp. JEL 0842]
MTKPAEEEEPGDPFTSSTSNTAPTKPSKLFAFVPPAKDAKAPQTFKVPDDSVRKPIFNFNIPSSGSTSQVAPAEPGSIKAETASAPIFGFNFEKPKQLQSLSSSYQPLGDQKPAVVGAGTALFQDPPKKLFAFQPAPKAQSTETNTEAFTTMQPSSTLFESSSAKPSLFAPVNAGPAPTFGFQQSTETSETGKPPSTLFQTTAKPSLLAAPSSSAVNDSTSNAPVPFAFGAAIPAPDNDKPLLAPKLEKPSLFQSVKGAPVQQHLLSTIPDVPETNATLLDKPSFKKESGLLFQSMGPAHQPASADKETASTQKPAFALFNPSLVPPLSSLPIPARTADDPPTFSFGQSKVESDSSSLPSSDAARPKASNLFAQLKLQSTDSLDSVKDSALPKPPRSFNFGAPPEKLEKPTVASFGIQSSQSAHSWKRLDLGGFGDEDNTKLSQVEPNLTLTQPKPEEQKPSTSIPTSPISNNTSKQSATMAETPHSQLKRLSTSFASHPPSLDVSAIHEDGLNHSQMPSMSFAAEPSVANSGFNFSIQKPSLSSPERPAHMHHSGILKSADRKDMTPQHLLKELSRVLPPPPPQPVFVKADTSGATSTKTSKIPVRSPPTSGFNLFRSANSLKEPAAQQPALKDLKPSKPSLFSFVPAAALVIDKEDTVPQPSLATFTAGASGFTPPSLSPLPEDPQESIHDEVELGEGLIADEEANLESLSSGSNDKQDASMAVKDNTFRMDELEYGMEEDRKDGTVFESLPEMSSVGDIGDEQIALDSIGGSSPDEEDSELIIQESDTTPRKSPTSSLNEEIIQPPREMLDIRDCSAIARASDDDAGDLVELQSEENFQFEDSSMDVLGHGEPTPGPNAFKALSKWGFGFGGKKDEDERDVIRGSLGVGGAPLTAKKIGFGAVPSGVQNSGGSGSPSKGKGGGVGRAGGSGQSGFGNGGGGSNSFGGSFGNKNGSAQGGDGGDDKENKKDTEPSDSMGTAKNVKIDLYAESIKELDDLEARLKHLASARSAVPGETAEAATERGFAEMRRIMRDFKGLVGKAKDDVKSIYGTKPSSTPLFPNTTEDSFKRIQFDNLQKAATTTTQEVGNLDAEINNLKQKILQSRNQIENLQRAKQKAAAEARECEELLAKEEKAVSGLKEIVVKKRKEVAAFKDLSAAGKWGRIAGLVVWRYESDKIFYGPIDQAYGIGDSFYSAPSTPLSTLGKSTWEYEGFWQLLGWIMKLVFGMYDYWWKYFCEDGPNVLQRGQYPGILNVPM